MSLNPFAARADDFEFYGRAQNLIGGQWSDSASGESLEIINPRHGRSMGSVTISGSTEVDRAVVAATAAQADWKNWPIRERAQVLYRFKYLAEKNLEELSWLLSHENGKTYSESKAEVLKGIECAEYGCALPNMAGSPQLDVSRGVNCSLSYEPLGVVAGVAPFNFPFMVPLWMLPQALVGGNAFIMKPSEQVPFCAVRLAQLFKEAGLPDGILNLVQGGKDAVQALTDHDGIAAFAFVGSTPVAKLLYGRAASTGKRSLCLGGAKNHLILVPDADPEVATENVVASFTGCAGQRCMAASVLLAVGEVDPLIVSIRDRAAGLVTGRDMGAITSKAAEERIRGFIADAEERGAKIILDGRDARGNDDGYWVGPTIIEGVTTDMPAWTEEIFGPVLSIIHVDTLDEAIGLENSCPYGNAAAIYTTSGGVVRRVVSELEAGMIGVNIGVPVPREPFGFGGWNWSKFGHGDITGWDGFRFWTRARKVTTKWAVQQDQNWMS